MQPGPRVPSNWFVIRQPALLMKHPGGELLAAMLGAPWELTQFLRVAMGLAVSLGRLHEHGLVHKDIKPANILVNKATGGVWLMGFGIASRVARERQAPEPPSVIAGRFRTWRLSKPAA